ncbi:glycosyltransferase family 4 protein [Glycomyces sp. L485]|uniref:glycosyltransferase family 4 protein n=1 Tax=Glycomyces sp. L485 TaxID=2909235 RepID=UPI001F4A76B5|nr:glycosyltransferase family 4 protein [Glycomyces sp. L485]MCH7232113.1 glycosyltransferase family 4 protein [Glycomyces sp. L485]
MRITFLVRNIWGIGGTIKTTLNTAEALVELGHDVTIASCVRHKDNADFVIDPRIEVVNLWDVRNASQGGETLSLVDKVNKRVPSFLDADKVNNMGESSRLLDKKVKRFLHDVDTDVLVSTQVSLNLYVARYGRPGCVKVAQEHLYLDNYPPEVRRRILDNYGRFDAIVTITEADAEIYRKAMPEHAHLVECVPNSIPQNPNEPSDLTEPVIMTAGRLTGMKGFDILVEAFGEIADRFPEWKVHIYGRGRDRKKLQRLIGEYGLRARVKLMGPVTPLDGEWRKAAIAAIPSRFEPFGLVIVEAMAAGLPVVCAAVKHGPLEIIENEVNGLLVKPKNPAELGEALARLMSDPELRRKIAEAGRRTAARFEPDQVVGQHVALFERLLKARP